MANVFHLFRDNTEIKLDVAVSFRAEYFAVTNDWTFYVVGMKYDSVESTVVSFRLEATFEYSKFEILRMTRVNDVLFSEDYKVRSSVEDRKVLTQYIKSRAHGIASAVNNKVLIYGNDMLRLVRG